MKINRCVQRTIAWFVFCLYSGIGLFAFFWTTVAEREPYGLFALIFSLFAFLLLLLFLYTYPKVSLDQQGIFVKWWFRTCYYPWGDICQVGISCFYHNWVYSNRMVLVRSDCSKRGYRDFFFHLRNFGKLIYIPAKTDIIHYVRSCYGPLDFDLTDGKLEQSIVVDE